MINAPATIRAELDKLLALLGSEGDYAVTKTAVLSKVTGLISPIDARDVDLVNAYGVNGMKMAFKAESFAQRPSKFDSWTCLGRKYVFDAVMDIVVKGETIGYVVYTKGLVG
jgi:hypothetical protein